MQLTFTSQHLGWIAQFVADKQLWFKVKTAWLASNKASITIPGLTPQDIISTYNQLSAQPEGLSASINQAIDADLLPQLLDANGFPHDDECAEVVAWIQQLKQGYADQRAQRIADGISTLDAP